MSIPPLSHDELHHLYHVERLSTYKIAEQFNVSQMQVRRWMKHYAIPARRDGRPLPPTAVRPSCEDLYRMIHIEGLSYSAIGKICGVNKASIFEWAEAYDIPRPRYRSEVRKQMNELPPMETIEAWYTSGCDIAEIARRCNLSYDAMYKVMKQSDIKLRTMYNLPYYPALARDGLMVRSSFEHKVCNWLLDHHVSHTHEPYILGSAASKRRQKRSDFLANGWYIEVWGLVGVPSYDARKFEKLALYRHLGLPLIEISAAAFGNDVSPGERWDVLLAQCLYPPGAHQSTDSV